MNQNINQYIFMTNAMLERTVERIHLWHEFECEVPATQRIGYFGADNVAYINFLRKRKENKCEEQ